MDQRTPNELARETVRQLTARTCDELVHLPRLHTDRGHMVSDIALGALLVELRGLAKEPA